VLAGGQSTRFGKDKAAAEFDGKKMLERAVAVLSEVVVQVNVVAPAGRYDNWGSRVVADQWPGEGPLGGIITALQNTERSSERQDWNLIVSCDMPFLTPVWLEYLVERAVMSDAQVVLAHSEHGPEPLCACWRTEAAETLQRAFESGVRRVTEGIARLRAEVLDERDWKRFDSAGRLFWNMNTLADYETAKRVLEAEEK
jgi:molybdopterin-guanine dinucleotide biosynthesis protein A